MASGNDVGRFSSTLLGQFGARRNVNQVEGVAGNVFSLSRGNESYPSPDSIALSAGNFSSGALSENTYTAIQAFYESRGASLANASAMASVTMDSAKMMGVHPMSLLDYNSSNTALSRDAYSNLNDLRTVSDQQHLVSDVNNRKSLKSRSIRA